MLVIIDADLSAPPSKISCFRDVTLFSTVFLDSEVLLECLEEFKDTYWKWLKTNYAFDFVVDIVPPFSEHGVAIRPHNGNITVKRIDYNTLLYVLGNLQRYLGN